MTPARDVGLEVAQGDADDRGVEEGQEQHRQDGGRARRRARPRRAGAVDPADQCGSAVIDGSLHAARRVPCEREQVAERLGRDLPRAVLAHARCPGCRAAAAMPLLIRVKTSPRRRRGRAGCTDVTVAVVSCDVRTVAPRSASGLGERGAVLQRRLRLGAVAVSLLKNVAERPRRPPAVVAASAGVRCRSATPGWPAAGGVPWPTRRMRRAATRTRAAGQQHRQTDERRQHERLGEEYDHRELPPVGRSTASVVRRTRVRRDERVAVNALRPVRDFASLLTDARARRDFARADRTREGVAP